MSGGRERQKEHHVGIPSHHSTDELTSNPVMRGYSYLPAVRAPTPTPPPKGRHRMPLIQAGQLKTASLQGAEYGASISLILDRSRPGQGPRLHRHPTMKPGSSRPEA